MYSPPDPVSPLIQKPTSTQSPYNFGNAIIWLMPLLLLASRTLADLCVTLTALAFLYFSWKHQNWGWAKSGWFRTCLVFWAYLLLLNTPFSMQPLESLAYAISFIRWPLFAAALGYWLLTDPRRQRAFLLGLLCVTTFILADTWLQFISGKDLLGHPPFPDNRLTGPFNSPVPGIMTVRVFFILFLLAGVLDGLNAPSRHIAFNTLLLVAGLTFIYITGERMALLLFMAGAVVILCGLWLQYPRHRGTVLLAAGFFITALLLTTQVMPEQTTQRALHSSTQKIARFSQSDYGQVFGAAYAAWQEYPLLGSGLHTYRDVCEKLGLLVNSGMNCTHPHNLYLHILAETGAIGLMLFAICVFAIYKTALLDHIHQRRWYLLAVAFTLISVSFWPLIGGISLLNNGVAALAWLGVGWTFALRNFGSTINSEDS